MKKKLGIITGFILGFAGFLLAFKLLILDYTSPSDELAPGIVIILSLLAGTAAAFTVYLLQNYFEKRSK